MRKLLVLALVSLTAVVSGCGHSPIDYTPKPLVSATDWQAALVVKLGLVNIRGKERAMLTRDFIAIIESKPANEIHQGKSAPSLNTSDFVEIENPLRRTYYRDLGIPIVSKSNSRSGSYAVTVVDANGSLVRNVKFFNEQSAKDFADALMYLRRAGSSPVLAPSVAPY